MAPTRHRSAFPATPVKGTVAAAFVRGMLAGAVRSGHDAATLLAAVGIAPDCLVDDRARVPLAAYAALYNHVNALLDDEAFGLFSAPMRVGCFEFLCRATITAPQLGEALARALRFLRAVLPDMAIAIARDGSAATLLIRERRALAVDRVFAYEWLLRLLHGLSCWLVGRGIALDAVDFPYPRPAHADDYALIYTADSRFDAPHLAARIAGNLLELPVRRDEAALVRFLDGAPGKLTMLYRNDREWVMRVRDHLRTAMPAPTTATSTSSTSSVTDASRAGGAVEAAARSSAAMPPAALPDLAATASALGLSPRTLNRHLEDEGSSFRAIKDALRRDLALTRLSRSTQPVADLAADLGYADSSAFYRAFIGWTGVSPSAYRRRLPGA